MSLVVVLATPLLIAGPSIAIAPGLSTSDCSLGGLGGTS